MIVGQDRISQGETAAESMPPLLPLAITVLCVIVALEMVVFAGVQTPPPLPLRESL